MSSLADPAILPRLKPCSQLAKSVPPSRGKETAASTVWRWMQEGRLRFVVVGDRWLSTEEWLAEMFEREAAEQREKRGIAPRQGKQKPTDPTTREGRARQAAALCGINIQGKK